MKCCFTPASSPGRGLCTQANLYQMEYTMEDLLADTSTAAKNVGWCGRVMFSDTTEEDRGKRATHG